MPKENYSAWHINHKDFSDVWSDLQKLQFFGRYAVLAPSGHNTQPWHFSHKGKELLIKANPSRHLEYSGVQAAEPNISIGTCLETLRLAALGYGYELDIVYSLKPTAIVTVKLGAHTKPDSSLLDAIVKRSSNRSFYKDEPLPNALLKKLTTCEFKDVSLSSLTKKSDIKFVAEQTVIATKAIMSDRQFRNELSKWVRNNLSRQYDGMPAFAQGMPLPPSLVAKHVIRKIDVSKDQAKKDSNRVLHSPALIVIAMHAATPQATLNAGRLYARICVLAQQAGYATSGVGAAAIDLDTKKALQRHLNLAHPPTALVRVGLASKPARHTPRWPFSKVSD